MFLISWTSGCVFKTTLIQNNCFFFFLCSKCEALAIDPLLCYINVVSKAIKCSLDFNEIFRSVIFFENVLKVLDRILTFV